MTVIDAGPTRRRRSTSPEPTGAVWAQSCHRTWRDRLWQLLGVLAVLLPMVGLVLAAWTGEELWLLPAAAVAALVAIVRTIWT